MPIKISGDASIEIISNDGKTKLKIKDPKYRKDHDNLEKENNGHNISQNHTEQEKQ